MTLPDSSSSLELLYDHFKETCLLIRESENKRKKYFLTLLAVLGFLVFCVAYTECTVQNLNEIEWSGFVKFNLSSIPFAIIVSLTWTYLLVIVILYYQSCVWINRQYVYLHKIEAQISDYIKSDCFCREGRAYKHEYPILLDWVWMLYAFVFPMLLLILTIRILFLEWYCQDNNFNLNYDTIFGFLILVTAVLFRFNAFINRQPLAL